MRCQDWADRIIPVGMPMSGLTISSLPGSGPVIGSRYRYSLQRGMTIWGWRFRSYCY